eukprot:g38043.t1
MGIDRLGWPDYLPICGCVCHEDNDGNVNATLMFPWGEQQYLRCRAHLIVASCEKTMYTTVLGTSTSVGI